MRLLMLAALLLCCDSFARAADGLLGIFTNQSDIGTPSSLGPGAAEYDANEKKYTVTGGGANIWSSTDAFHFVWKKASGDLSLAAAVEFAPQTAAADPHRKVVLMIRQSLDPASPYADACVHGNGLTAFQWRDSQGDPTYETQAQANAPKRVRIEKRGNYFSMSFGNSDTDMHPAGGACKVEIAGDYYLGIGVCAHNAARLEKAVFSDVAVMELTAGTAGRTNMISTLETIRLSSKDRRTACVLTQPQLQRAEAPNWTNDDMLYFNNRGKLFKIKADLPAATPPVVSAAAPEAVDLGILTNINNDHAISPDGKSLAVSDQSQGNRQSAIWVLPLERAGATLAPPKRLTENTPSYFHGWSPDGKTLAFCGLRSNNFDIYTVPVEGGPEQRLTDSPAKDDGPEYTPDGQFIYFNSDRTRSMQIWRMKPDGAAQEQVTKDDLNNWFPHVSPDGQQMVFITYETGVVDHPENKDVQLRLMNLRTGSITVLAKLFGGQGTMNVPSWSPNSQYLAFMSYQIVPQ
jgi:TolB protein